MIKRESIKYDGNIDKIYHIADVHIRNLKRHKEYREVFERLYKYIKDTKTAGSIIVLAGDIVHAKTDMTPEVVEMTQTFLKSLADMCPTILIPGNHDANLNNTSRLDALSPIVNALNHPKLYYYKYDAVVDMGQLTFIHTSVFSADGKIINPEDIDGDYKIALYHGAVDKVHTEHGFEIEHNDVTVQSFDGYDLALLGDIHVPNQSLNVEGTIKYCGSTIMQNHAEAKYPNHGILVWDVATKESEFVPIENDYGYVTVEIDKGKVVNKPEIPYKPRIRVRVSDTKQSRVKEIISEIRVGRRVQEISIQKVVTGLTNSSNGNQLHLENVRDVAFQNKLITQYLDDGFILSDEQVNIVKEINKDINKKLGAFKGLKNVIWRPKRFEFSNMFSYGENNVLDFTNMRGTYGIFAPNTSGKSSLWDALSFCIFDKCSRTSKAINVLNYSKSTFNCKFEFDINGESYFIERVAKKSPKRGTVKVDVDFYKIDKNGIRESLNGEERRETNAHIRNYVGSYEDFTLTSLSTQADNTGFIKKSQKERKELLAQFLDMDVFEELYQLANSELKELATLLKDYKNRDYTTKLAVATEDLKDLKKSMKGTEKSLKETEKLYNDVSKKVNSLIQKKKTIQGDLQNLDDLLDTKSQKEDSLDKKNTKCKSILDSKKSLKIEYDKLKADILVYDYQDLLEKDREHTACCKLLATHKTELTLVDTEIEHKQSHLDGIGSLTFDDGCEHCVKNKNTPFAKQSHNLSKDLDDLNIRKSHLEMNIQGLETKANDYDVSVELAEYNSIQTRMTDIKSELERLEYDYKSCKLEVKNLMADLDRLGDVIKKVKSKQKTIAFNKQIDDTISELNPDLEKYESELKDWSDELTEIKGDIKVQEKIINDANNSLTELKDMENKYNGYEYYLKCVKRDGIPYKLISEILPKIEDEINNILSSIVDFNIVLDTDGKNINSYIAYSNEEYWPLELTSGMEKFISSVAIRTALVNISNLPRPNFITIDEGFSSLDSSNFSSLYLLFDYLKTQFEFIVTISHIDKTRDMVEHIIDIEKTNGFSSIRYL